MELATKQTTRPEELDGLDNVFADMDDVIDEMVADSTSAGLSLKRRAWDGVHLTFDSSGTLHNDLGQPFLVQDFSPPAEEQVKDGTPHVVRLFLTDEEAVTVGTLGKQLSDLLESARGRYRLSIYVHLKSLNPK
jgi:hypothetical protein